MCRPVAGHVVEREWEARLQDVAAAEADLAAREHRRPRGLTVEERQLSDRLATTWNRSGRRRRRVLALQRTHASHPFTLVAHRYRYRAERQLVRVLGAVDAEHVRPLRHSSAFEREPALPSLAASKRPLLRVGGCLPDTLDYWRRPESASPDE